MFMAGLKKGAGPPPYIGLFLGRAPTATEFGG